MVLVLLVLTPWPMAMMLVAAGGMIIWIVKYGRKLRSKMLLMPGIAFLLAAAIAVVLILVRGR